jgi:hypothetical protein
VAHLVSIINGKAPSAGSGGVTDKDFSNLAVNFLSKGVVQPNDYKLEQQVTPNMTVKVNTGKAYVPNATGSMLYQTELDASVNATIGANASGNPRIDAIVIKVDVGATPNSTASNVATIAVVQGTPAGSPSAPNDAAIQAAVGAGNPFYRLGNVTVANAAASITNANIASTRDGVILRVVGGYLRYNLATSKLQFSNDGSTWGDVGSTVPARCRVSKTADQSIPDNAPTVVTFDAEQFDTAGMHDNVTNNSRITIQTPGVYLIVGQASWATNASGRRDLSFKLNGNFASGSGPWGTLSKPANAGFDAANISQVAVLAAADYVELSVFQSSGGALNLKGGASDTGTCLTVIYLGASA